MKEFEKWCKSEPSFKCMLTHSCEKCRNDGELIWQAALEWVKREAISLDERGDISREIINRELKGD